MSRPDRRSDVIELMPTPLCREVHWTDFSHPSLQASQASSITEDVSLNESDIAKPIEDVREILKTK
jgi:hypothetical protein